MTGSVPISPAYRDLRNGDVMDIEERAEKWADENTACDAEKLVAVAAYLAGSAQTQADYAADDCRRCVCTCGAR